jgi:hypothetical protein
MRNYIKIHRCEVTTVSGDTTFLISCFGLDEDSVLEQSRREIAAWNDILDPDPTWNTTPVYVNYVELDREIIIAGLTMLFRRGLANNLPSEVLDVDTFGERLVDESPRDTWSNGV